MVPVPVRPDGIWTWLSGSLTHGSLISFQLGLSCLISLLYLVKDGATPGMKTLQGGTFPSPFSQGVLLKWGGISDKPLENHLIRTSLGPLRQLPALKNKQTNNPMKMHGTNRVDWNVSIHFSIISHQGKGKEGNKLCAWNTVMETFPSQIKMQLFITSGNTLTSSSDPWLVSMLPQKDCHSESFMITT